MLCMVIVRKSRAFSFPNRNVPHIPVDEEASDRICSQFQSRLTAGRHGHLFQNRYKSILCEEDIYLKDLRESGRRVNSDERIPGGSEFVERVLMQANEEWERKALIKKSGIDLDGLLEKVGNHFCVDVKELKSGSRSRDIAKARSVLCCLGVRNLGLTCVTMAKALGVSPSAVSKSIARGRNILQAQDIEDKLMKS